VRLCDIEGCGGKHYAKDFCAMHYNRNRLGKEMVAFRDLNPIEKLMNSIVRNSGLKGLCWEFTGTRSTKGYGKVWTDGKLISAHRISWEHHNNQEIPEGLCVLHSCDNPPCVNPDHLSIGTHKKNAEERSERNRNGDQNGENNGSSKLSNEDVIFIYQNTTMSAKELSNMFNVNVRNINRIKDGTRWSHLTKHREIA